LFGYYIVEYEQNGEDSAKYGENLIANITQKVKHIKGLTGNQLYVCRNFYLLYPHFLRTVSVILQSHDREHDEISRTLSVKSPLNDDLQLSPELLLSRLSFSHFIELIRVDDPLQRLFYEVEAIKNNWSVRELKRAIGTSLAFRTVMSINKEAVIAKIKNLKPTANAEVIRNPYVLEFLDLDEKSEYNESGLRFAQMGDDGGHLFGGEAADAGGMSQAGKRLVQLGIEVDPTAQLTASRLSSHVRIVTPCQFGNSSLSIPRSALRLNGVIEWQRLRRLVAPVKRSILESRKDERDLL
jgi:hypothetical protein